MDLLAQIHDGQDQAMLGLIDDMRQLFGTRYESLMPQIVVVGQQSSGKSCVLKALSGIPFPSNDGLCTQFAIEVVCRRSQNAFTRASIVTFTLDEARQARYKEFAVKWSDRQMANKKDVQDVIQDARSAMGLTQAIGYSNDKLRLEFSGPLVDHLTIIDLPGLISQEADGHAGEREQIDQLVTDYLRGDQTIILTIVHGQSNLLNQRVFGMSKEYASRRLGIITAPDTIDWDTPHGVNMRELALNKNAFRADCGWHLVRNLRSDEVRAGQNRDDTEAEYFSKLEQSSAWEGMDQVSLGIRSLKKKIGMLVMDKISGCLPDLQRDLGIAMDKCRKVTNTTVDDQSFLEQKEYLIEKARLVSDGIRDSLDGVPSELTIDCGEASLRNKIRNANANFVSNMETKGSLWQVLEASTESTSTDPAKALKDRKITPFPVSKMGFIQYIADSVSKNPGKDFDGTFHPGWVSLFFRQQSSKWGEMVYEHADDICDIVERELEVLIHYHAGSEIGERLMNTIFFPNLQERRQSLHAKMAELLSPYEHRLTATLTQSSILQLSHTVNQAESNDNPIATTLAEGDIKLQHGLRIYQCVEMYYANSIRVLLENVQNLGIEMVLLRNLHDILRPEDVAVMTEENLGKLMGQPGVGTVDLQLSEKRTDIQERGSRLTSRPTIRSKKFISPKRPVTEPPRVTVSPAQSHLNDQRPRSESVNQHVRSSTPPGLSRSATATPATSPSPPQLKKQEEINPSIAGNLFTQCLGKLEISPKPTKIRQDAHLFPITSSIRGTKLGHDNDDNNPDDL